MGEIKVSILVPAYNVEAYAEECLRSLLVQTLQEIEIVWVDDGSTDRTHEVATRFAASDARLRLFRLPTHLGVSAARNACLKEARGRYIIFVDSDDTISPEAVEHLWRKAVASDADIVTGSVLYCYADGTQKRVGDKQAVFVTEKTVWDGQTCFRLLQECGCYVPMVCGNLYRTAFVREHGLHFEGDFHEDEYFTPYALYYARRVAELKEDFYFYRQRDNSIMHNPDNHKARAEALYRIGQELRQFAATHANRVDSLLRTLYEAYADSLHRRSQTLYEAWLHASPRKCLLIFTEDSIASRYGVGTYIRQLQLCFDQAKWDVNTVTLHTTGKDMDFSIEKGIACYAFPSPEDVPLSFEQSEEKYQKSVFYYLVSRIGERKIYCHFNFSHHHLLAKMFKEKLQAFTAFTLHYTDWSFDLLGDRAWLERILSSPVGTKDRRVQKKFEQEKAFMQEYCDRVIAISRHSYRMLCDLYGISENKLAYVPNGLQDEYEERTEKERLLLRRKYGLEEQETIILFAGRLDRVKGVLELMEAFKQVLDVYPNVRLVVAGNGDFQHCMEAVSPRWKQVTFTGFLSKEQLYEWYAISNIGVVPSIYEEFGYVAAEMLLHRLPVVAHDTTGIREITDDGKYGMLFHFPEDRKDVSSLRDALLNVIIRSKSKEYEDVKDRGRQRVLENYLIPDFCKRMQNIYQSP